MSQGDEDPQLGQEQEPNEGGLPETPQSSLETPSSGDPLDTVTDVSELRSLAIGLGSVLGKDVIKEIAGITDPDALRGTVKKYRSIQQRVSKETKDTPAADAPAAKAPEALTMKDLHRINTQRAIEIAKEDPEIAENWSAIQAEYVNRSGMESPEAIVKDIKRAHSVWKALKPADQGNPGADLQTSRVTKSDARPAQTGERKTDPLLRKSQSMKDWYPKQG